MPVTSDRLQKLRNITRRLFTDEPEVKSRAHESVKKPHFDELCISENIPHNEDTLCIGSEEHEIRRPLAANKIDRLQSIKRKLVESFGDIDMENLLSNKDKNMMQRNESKKCGSEDNFSFTSDDNRVFTPIADKRQRLRSLSRDRDSAVEPRQSLQSPESTISYRPDGDFSPASDDDRTYVPTSTSKKRRICTFSPGILMVEENNTSRYVTNERDDIGHEPTTSGIRRQRKCSASSCNSSISSSSSDSSGSSFSSTSTSSATTCDQNNGNALPDTDENREDCVPEVVAPLALADPPNVVPMPENPIRADVSAEVNCRKILVPNKKKLAQALRNKGKSYISASSKIVSERKIGPSCSDKCRLKCGELITNESRQNLFENYWKMGSLIRQRDYIAMHTTSIVPRYQYKKVDSNRKLKNAFYFVVDNNKIRVCKTFFKNTLGINDRPIRTVLDGKNQQGTLQCTEKRGKHNKTALPVELKDGIRQHIESIPRIESHYLRQQTTREYIDGGKTLTDLFNDYKQSCISRNLPHAKIHIYRAIFKTEYNISFFVPKKDQCDDCVAYKNADEAEKENMKEHYENHLNEKKLSRTEKEADKKSIGPKRIVSCYDLQAVMNVPKGDVSTFYYKSKLNCLNFTISELGNDHTECYFWTEIEGNRGVNEIASCVYKFLGKMSSSNPDSEFIFYSDNCCGQQKNNFMFFMYEYALRTLPIKSITHKFLVKGHTQNEGDAVHSTIEREVKKMLKSGSIFVPAQYIAAIRSAKKRGRPYIINEMSHTEFFDIKVLCNKSIKRNTDGEKVKIGNIRILKVEKSEDDPGKVHYFYKSSYADSDFKEIKLEPLKVATRRQGSSTNAVIAPLKSLYQSKIPIGERKRNDLKYLIDHNHIPKYYASSYYDHILS